MSTVLGLFGVVLYVIGTISVAAAITYTVVRFTPAKKPAEQSTKS